MENQQPKKNIAFPLIIIAGIILLAAGLLLINTQKTNRGQNDQRQTTSLPAQLPKEAAVKLTGNGFNPQTVTIKVGGAVRWTNETGKEASVNSDDYPTNQKYKELNLGIFGNGSTLMLIFNKPGTYTYHNQFNPKHKGTVIVE